MNGPTVQRFSENVDVKVRLSISYEDRKEKKLKCLKTVPIQ